MPTLGVIIWLVVMVALILQPDLGAWLDLAEALVRLPFRIARRPWHYVRRP